MVTSVVDDSTRHMHEFLVRSKAKKRISPAVKGPTRRPMQQSTHWNPPPQNHHQQQPPHFQGRGGGAGPPGRYVNHPPRPFGRGGSGSSVGGHPRGGGTGGGGSSRMNGNVRGGAGGGRGRGGGGGNRFNNNVQRTPLREPKENFNRGGGGGGGGHRAQSNKNYPSNKSSKTPPKGHNNRQPAKPATNYKEDLHKYFEQHNLGEVPYKVAPVGTKGKEKYMATVTVEGKQFKTYPQTFNSRVSKTCSYITKNIIGSATYL